VSRDGPHGSAILGHLVDRPIHPPPPSTTALGLSVHLSLIP
jgi:hypothetical protein